MGWREGGRESSTRFSTSLVMSGVLCCEGKCGCIYIQVSYETRNDSRSILSYHCRICISFLLHEVYHIKDRNITNQTSTEQCSMI